VGERVPERVLGVREQPRLVEELPRLELGQALAQSVLGLVGDGLEQLEGDVALP
jgi:hypothetical protein